MKTLKQLAELTDNNDHSTAMVECAKIILDRLKDKPSDDPIKFEMETILFHLKRIRDDHHRRGQLVVDDYHERYTLYKRMMEIIKEIDAEFHKKLYACL